MLKKIKAIPLTSVFVALSGIIVGLIIGFLISIPIDKMPYAWSWIVSMIVYILAVASMLIFFLSRREVIVDFVSKVWSDRLARLEHGPVKSRQKIAWERVKLLDSSAIIDGRVADIVRTGFLDGFLIVPSFILGELQRLADSKNQIKRSRGRHGLEILEELRKEEFIAFKVYPCKANKQIDTALIELALSKKACIVTTDFNLSKVGKVRGVKVLNINELANMVKTVLIPGEEVMIKIIQEGKEEKQGIAYLPDGTMIVVEDGRKMVGQEVRVVVERLFQTEAGRMIFARRTKS